MEFLSDRELASKTDSEIEEYVRSLVNEGMRLKYAVGTTSSKFWKRVKSYREGMDADLTYPKKKVYVKKSKRKSSEDEAPTPLVRSPKFKSPTARKDSRPEVKKVVLEVGSKD